MHGILELNLLGLFFIYGLSFYTMGAAIALQYRSYSSFRLAYSLSLLAAFGLFHGLSEWGNVFVPVNVPYLGEFPTWKLIALQRLLQALSHFFLLLFGTKLISDTKGKNPWWFFFPIVVLLVWLIQFARFIPLIENPDVIDWLVISESWSRYLLAFPGGLLTAYGLALQMPEVKELNNKSVRSNLWCSVAAFLMFAFFSGLVMPQSVGIMGTTISGEAFRRIVGLPVELFRTLVAVIIMYCITRMLTVFDIEKQRELEDSHHLQAVLHERERFAHDLHDDVIQAIYGIGVNLQTVSHVIKKDGVEAEKKVKMSVERLNQVIHALRSYIHELEMGGDSSDLEEMLEQLVDGFRRQYNMDIKVRILGKKPPGEQLEFKIIQWQKQIQQIVREALNNIVKHANATMAGVTLNYRLNSLLIEIADNGEGFCELETDNQSTHRGLSNMRARAELLEGTLKVEATEKSGTRVELTIPYRKVPGGVKCPK